MTYLLKHPTAVTLQSSHELPATHPPSGFAVVRGHWRLRLQGVKHSNGTVDDSEARWDFLRRSVFLPKHIITLEDQGLTGPIYLCRHGQWSAPCLMCAP
jgi:hypothetical protein